jgi:hypothetical protein
VGHLCDRLEVMGFGLSDVGRTLRAFVQELISLELRYHIGVRDPVKQRLRKAAQDAEIDLLNRSTLEQWREADVRLTNEWYCSNSIGSSARGPLDRYLYEFRSEEPDAPIAGIRSPFGSVRSRLRAMLSAFDAGAEARLDCSVLIAEGWMDPGAKLTEAAIDRLLAPARATEPTIVLTEGPTDTRILSRSLERLCPHLRGFYTFLDHEGFAPPTGTGNIANLFRGLAASGISNRVIAVFDNDSAGRVAASGAQKHGYPKNFRVLVLPPLERGRSYPTIGPSGPLDMDINGKACSLELYLGAGALTGEDGALVPILWTGYEGKLRQYQGELSRKAEVQERYLKRLKDAEIGSIDPQFDDMRGVLRAIVDAFACRTEPEG